MNTNKLLQNIRWGGPPFVIVAVTTLAAIATSIYCLSSGWVIIFQNLFYVPIIIACVFYTKKGFAFSVFLSFIYLFLIIAFTRNSAVIIQALVRVCIFVGVAGVTTFVSIKRKRVEQALKETLELKQAVLNNISYAVSVIDTTDFTIVSANKPFLDTYKLEEEEAIGKHCYEVTHQRSDPCNLPDDICPLLETLKTGETASAEHIHFDGRGGKSFCEILTSPMRNEKGKIYQVVHLVKDITDRKREQEKIHASLLEKETMLKEIHHRVKNNLQVISSLLNMQATHVQDEKAREALRESMSRMRTMASIHTQLYQSPDLARIDYGLFIRDLIGNIRQSYGRAASPVEIKVDAEEIRLGIDASIPCGLILNELVANALKHAFPEGKEGEINIRMRSADNRVALTVCDNGIGFPESIDLTNVKSLGLELVNILVRQMNGKIDMQAGGGTTWTVTFPVKNEKSEAFPGKGISAMTPSKKIQVPLFCHSGPRIRYGAGPIRNPGKSVNRNEKCTIYGN
jgi:PAS domain S-box-containing protein